MNLTQFKERFDVKFSVYLEEKKKEFLKFYDLNEVEKIIQQVEKISLNGGKRFRPYALYKSYKAFKQDKSDNFNDIFTILASIELLHIFALIHDDIMDNGELRHGVKTIHTLFDDTRYAEAQAILAGDLVFQWSQESFEESFKYFVSDSAKFWEAKRQYNILVKEVIYGQMMDIALTQEKVMQKERIIKKMELKTARYTFVNPIKIGAILAGASAEEINILEKFSVDLGIAFQLQDDLLDIDLKEQDSKDKMQDIETKQHTLLNEFVFNQSDNSFKEELKKYFGKSKLCSEEKKEALKILINSGAINSIQNEANNYFKSAENTVNKLDKGQHKHFLEILNLVKSRSK